MEWYVNFGTTGIVLGFFVVGGLLGLIDRKARYWLEHGSVQHFAVWYLPGLALLQVGGAFVEVVSTAAACLAVTGILHYMTRRSAMARPADESESLDVAPLEDQ